MTTFGLLVDFVCRNFNFSQEELADYWNISADLLKQWKNNRGYPKGKAKISVEDIADIFINPQNASFEMQGTSDELIAQFFSYIRQFGCLDKEMQFDLDKNHFIIFLNDFLRQECKEPANPKNRKNLLARKEILSEHIPSFDLNENEVYVINQGKPFFHEVQIELLNETFALPMGREDAAFVPENWIECREFLSAHHGVVDANCNTVRSCFLSRTDGARENNRIVGVKESNHSPGRLALKLYQTDYFTHRVVESVMDEMGIDVAVADTEDANKAFLRTSLGVNVILRIPCDHKILLVRRSKRASYGNEGKIYPSVVETVDLEHKDFSNCDSDPITACIARGLEEELGIPTASHAAPNEKLYHVDVRSVFHTKKYRQDNIFAIVTLKEQISMADLGECILHGSVDFVLENTDLIEIADDSEAIEVFLNDCKTKMIGQTKYCLRDYLWLKNQGLFP